MISSYWEEFYLLIYLRGAVCSAHLYLCVHTCPCACAVCRSKANARCFPLLFSTSVFETESLSDPRANTWEWETQPQAHTCTAVSHFPTGPSPPLQEGIQGGFKKEKVWLPGSLYFLSCPCLFVLLIIPIPWREAVGLLSASTFQSDAFACLEDTQNAFLRWFFLVPKEWNCKDTDLEFSAVILSSKERIAWEMKLTGKDCKIWLNSEALD